jgi:hypothetical protein
MRVCTRSLQSGLCGSFGLQLHAYVYALLFALPLRLLMLVGRACADRVHGRHIRCHHRSINLLGLPGQLVQRRGSVDLHMQRWVRFIGIRRFPYLHAYVAVGANTRARDVTLANHVTTPPQCVPRERMPRAARVFVRSVWAPRGTGESPNRTVYTACSANTFSAAAATSCSNCPASSTSEPSAATCQCLAGFLQSGTGASLSCTRTSAKHPCSSPVRLLANIL